MGEAKRRIVIITINTTYLRSSAEVEEREFREPVVFGSIHDEAEHATSRGRMIVLFCCCAP